MEEVSSVFLCTILGLSTSSLLREPRHLSDLCYSSHGGLVYESGPMRSYQVTALPVCPFLD